MLNLHFLRDRRRAALIVEPFPPLWETYLNEHVAHYRYLSDEEAARLRDDLRIFVAEKTWEGAGGSEVTDEMRVTVAAQACLLLLGWDDAHRAELFPNAPTVIVYPAGFRASRKRRQGFLEGEEQSDLLGEAWEGDWPVVLAWDSVRAGGEDAEDGENLVLHEFAHKLDMENGTADGVPRLHTPGAYDMWTTAFASAYQALRNDAQRGHHSLLSSYGATNEAEFFAVATEAFFERAVQMREQMPALYDVMRTYYQQDTAARLERASLTTDATR